MTLQQQMPNLKIAWDPRRGKHKINFKRPWTFLNLGQKGSGKSALLETIGCFYPKMIDLFGSRDNEGLGWCRSPFQEDVLFLLGDSVDLNSCWDTMKISNLNRATIERDFKDYKVILAVSAFFGDMNEEFECLNKVVDSLYYRTHWREPWIVMIREAGNFIYSRIKMVKNQTIAKNEFVYLLREARHCGYAIGADTLRWTSIDKEIRDVSDYIFLKRLGIMGLPRDLRWVYRYVQPMAFSNPKPSEFICVSSRGPLGAGRFSKPFWHKDEKEDILNLLKLKPEYGDIPDYGDEARNTVSDFEHADIIRKYVELKGMVKVGKALGRSPATVLKHIQDHKKQVGDRGYCIKCKRVKGEFFDRKDLKN